MPRLAFEAMPNPLAGHGGLPHVEAPAFAGILVVRSTGRVASRVRAILPHGAVAGPGRGR
jgi:hypothetical protein